MACYLLHSYLPAFCSTIAIELGVALLLGYWDRRSLLAVFLVNVVTHPTIHFFLLGIFYFRLMPIHLPLLLAIELAVFLTEGFLLAYALRLRLARAGFLSFAMNASSYLIGLLLLN